MNLVIRDLPSSLPLYSFAKICLFAVCTGTLARPQATRGILSTNRLSHTFSCPCILIFLLPQSWAGTMQRKVYSGRGWVDHFILCLYCAIPRPLPMFRCCSCKIRQHELVSLTACRERKQVHRLQYQSSNWTSPQMQVHGVRPSHTIGQVLVWTSSPETLHKGYELTKRK